MKNVISFSLWGDDIRYLEGALRNASLAHQWYPGWICRFYVPCSFGEKVLERRTLERLDKMNNVELAFMLDEYPRMFWRFLVADDIEVNRFLVRDADSRITEQEVMAVLEWMQEDTILHTCRAHPAHARPINGGMWGAMWKRPDWNAPWMSYLIDQFIKEEGARANDYGKDQEFLGRYIWPWACRSATQHDAVCRSAYPGSKPFPMKWPHPRFMGEVWLINQDGTETPRPGDWEQITEEKC